MKSGMGRSILVLFDQGLVSGTSFLTGILLTRLLGLEAYGVFVLLWMVVLFGLSVTQALITKPLQSIAPKMDKEDSDIYLSDLHAVQLLFSMLTFIIILLALYVFSFFAFREVLDIQTIFGLSMVTAAMLAYDFYRKCFFLKNDILAAVFSDTLLAILQIGGIFLLALLDSLSVSSFLLLAAFNYLLLVLFGFFKIIRPRFQKKALKNVLQKHYAFSKWLLGTVAAQWVCGNFFIICAGSILGTAAVGAVRIAQNVIGLTHVIFLAMENIVPISAARIFKEGGPERLFAFLKRITIRIGWGVMLLLLLVALGAPYILSFLYGAENEQYSYILIGFCIIYLLVYISYPLRFALRTLEITKPIFIAYIISAVFSLFAADIFISNWGIGGVLGGLFITQLITQFVYIFSLWKTKKYYENHSFDTR